ncbi:hypothetical protein ACHAQE_007752 [Botrytis cinerea]
MTSRPSPNDKPPDNLDRPHQVARSKISERENRRAVTYPLVHDRHKGNPAKNKVIRVREPSPSSSNNNRKVEPDVNDQKQRPDKSKPRRLIASIFGRKKADQTTRNHEGEEMNVENGKAKGKKKTGGSKSDKKRIKIPTLGQYIMNEGPGRTR